MTTPQGGNQKPTAPAQAKPMTTKDGGCCGGGMKPGETNKPKSDKSGGCCG